MSYIGPLQDDLESAPPETWLVIKWWPEHRRQLDLRHIHNVSIDGSVNALFRPVNLSLHSSIIDFTEIDFSRVENYSGPPSRINEESNNANDIICPSMKKLDLDLGWYFEKGLPYPFVDCVKMFPNLEEIGLSFTTVAQVVNVFSHKKIQYFDIWIEDEDDYPQILAAAAQLDTDVFLCGRG